MSAMHPSIARVRIRGDGVVFMLAQYVSANTVHMSTLASRLETAILAQPDQDDRRGATRYDVSVAVEVLTTDGVPLASEVTNISGSGFRARSPIHMPKGTKVVVRFNKTMRRRAYIAWQIGEDIGCRLLRGLTPGELAAVLKQSA
jgi:hypothetical protein